MNPQRVRAQRFSRAQRLTRPSEFSRVMADASRSADRYFTVLSRPATGKVSRLGLAIAKKAARRAVDRNRIKRLARESFRTGSNAAALDLIVFARPAASGETAIVLRRSLDRHFAALHARQAVR